MRKVIGKALVGTVVLLSILPEAGRSAPFDHSHKLYGTVLEKYVKGGLIDYSALKSCSKELNKYLEQAEAVSEADFSAWTREQQLAFLINLYNAETLRLIVDHYPIKSIKDIAADSKGPWELPVVRLFGRMITLNALEHEVIRKNYSEPRVHFALVCAALGCPDLREEPYIPERLNRQLEEQGRQFMGDSRKNRVDLEKRVVYLSPVFQWFPEDFITAFGSVPLFVEKYFPSVAAKDFTTGNFKIEYTNYDWSLNDSSSKRG